ncbi:MAG TPA: TolC family protein [Terriglobales bacterium]|nr:TolC family protein [Terriglobales bacterium]
METNSRFTPAGRLVGTAISFGAFLLMAAPTLGQATQIFSLAAQTGSQAPSNAPLTLTLQDALQRAKANSPQFQAALTELGLAQQDRVQSRAALLPSVNYNMEYLYTQGNGTHSNAPLFIANNAVHEYVAQGDVHQVLSPETVAEYRRTGAALAVAKAKSEIAARGLVVTVVQAYYAYVVAQRKYATAQLAASEAQRFLDISQKLEKGGEVAHSDVVKAQIQYNQRQRDLQETQLEMNKSRLEIAVLLFPDFNENFAVVDDLRLPVPLPTFEEVQAAASNKNPELRAAIAALKEANQAVTVAWSALLPSISADYFYGIDASRFATRTDGLSNLGDSASVTLQLPIWAWGANRSKIRQADLRRNQARVELSFTQRQLLANLRSFYNELQAARSELELLSQSAEMAAESLRLTSLRYQAGEASVLEVVDAQNTLTQARNAYDDGQVRFRVAQANLQTLTGTL